MRGLCLLVLTFALLALSSSKVCFPKDKRCNNDFAYLQSRVQALTTDKIAFRQRYEKDLQEIRRNEISQDGNVQNISHQVSHQSKKITDMEDNLAKASYARKALLQKVNKANKTLHSRLEAIAKQLELHNKFKAEINRLAAENSAQKSQLLKTSKILAKTEAMLKSLIVGLLSLQRQNKLISFSAYVTPSIKSIRRYIPIPFRGVLNNAGGGYNPNGTFTAPVAGTYHFYCTLLLADYGEASIFVDGSAKGRTLAGGGGKEDGLEMAGNSFIIHLHRGS